MSKRLISNQRIPVALAFIVTLVLVVLAVTRLRNGGRSQPILIPVGTNLLKPGMVLYDPKDKQRMGIVLEVDKWHEFPDGTDREGILVLSKLGITIWTPRATMTNVLVGSSE